jgi:membrane-bound lytic murein transglycosylase B
MKLTNKLLYTTLLFFGFCIPTFAADDVEPIQPKLTDREDVKTFINQMVDQHKFDHDKLVALFNNVKIQPKIITIMDRPAEGKPWKNYRPIFVTPKRINEGVVFWQQNETALKHIEKQYHVPASVIVAIIGAETFYGKQRGDYLVIEALSTLGFDYPRRAPFFKSELGEFLLLTREEKMDPMAIKGSYAGAMGPGQFMPSNYRKYAVDYDKSGTRDLLGNMDDAIASVANYLKEYGWEYGRPVAVKATANNDKYQTLLNKGSQPFTTVKEAKLQGLKLQSHLPNHENVSVLSLDGDQGQELWVTTNNFYVITGYNKSQLYAMAVYQLSDEIAKAKKLVK